MTEEQAKILLQKYQDGLCTPEEEAAINQWMEAKGNSAILSDEEQDIFKAELDKRITAATGVSIIAAEPGQQKTKLRRLPAAIKWIAAAVIIAVISGALIYFNYEAKPVNTIAATTNTNDILPGSDKAVLVLSNGEEIQLQAQQIINDGGNSIQNINNQLVYGKSAAAGYNTMKTPKGGQYKIVLSDGTKVWLNAASSISYPTVFNDRQRKVTVSGEVYFEVARDANKPFVVSLPAGTDVQVLGTSFNVNTYNNEEEQKVTLVEGSVAVKRNSEISKLNAGQQALVKSAIRVAKRTCHTIKYKSY